MQSLEARPDLVEFTERLSAPYAAELLASDHVPMVVDVRAPREREQKYIEGSVSIPLSHLAERAKELAKLRAARHHGTPQNFRCTLLDGNVPLVA